MPTTKVYPTKSRTAWFMSKSLLPSPSSDLQPNLSTFDTGNAAMKKLTIRPNPTINPTIPTRPPTIGLPIKSLLRLLLAIRPKTPATTTLATTPVIRRKAPTFPTSWERTESLLRKNDNDVSILIFVCFVVVPGMLLKIVRNQLPALPKPKHVLLRLSRSQKNNKQPSELRTL